MAFIWFCIASRLLGDITRRCLQLQVAVAPHTFSGWWLTYPSEKYDSQLGLLFPIYGKKTCPNHQPGIPCLFFFNVLFASQRTNAPHTLSAWRSQSPHLRLADLPATWDTCAMADLKDGNINRELSVVNQKNNDPHSYGDGSKPWYPWWTSK